MLKAKLNQTTQAFSATETTIDQNVLAISWNIATEPKLYWQLAPNPYSPEALRIISERFPNSNSSDVIRAVILAEPKREYDRNFEILEPTQQKEDLAKQIAISTEIDKRLIQYCDRYATEFGKLSKEFIYDSLFLIVFETADLKEVERRYSQDQRREARLSIVNFIENLPVIKAIKKKPSWTQPLLKVAFATLSIVLIFCIGQISTKNPEQDPEISKQVLGAEYQNENRELPLRLKIPKINVDATIEYVGLASKKTMGVPDNSVDVGWFELGVRPGEKGSAVIAGHFDGKNGEVGVFTNLHKLKGGDKLYIEDAKGKTVTFIVRESRTYDPGYADEVFNPNDSPHLNLVTCDGAWNGTKKSYTKRLVVFADLVHE